MPRFADPHQQIAWCLVLALLGACTANDDVPAPQLGSVTPSRAAPGTVVMIVGSYFCQRPDTGNEELMCPSTGQVTFGAASGTVGLWTETAIMVEVPQSARGLVPCR